MTAIIDYDAGNIKSVEKALLFLGEDTVVTRDEKIIVQADRVILPGVGAFGDAMEKLHRYGLVEVIRKVVDAGIPFLGICLGMQLMFERSDESDGVRGLALLDGEIRKIPYEPDIKIPHIGWNSLTYPNPGRLFAGIPENSYVYFVHSYYLKAKDQNIVTAEADYGSTRIHASIEKGNLLGCQFHPEKSSTVGLTILKRFLSLQREG